MANEWDVVRREPIAASRAVAPANTQADPWAVVSQQGGEIHDLPAITATTSDVGQEILANFADIMGGAQPQFEAQMLPGAPKTGAPPPAPPPAPKPTGTSQTYPAVEYDTSPTLPPTMPAPSQKTPGQPLPSTTVISPAGAGRAARFSKA